MIKRLNINEDVTDKDIKSVMNAAIKARTTSDMASVLKSLRDIDNTKYKYFNKRWNSGIITASEIGKEIYDNLSDTINANESINKEFSKKTINESTKDVVGIVNISKSSLADIRKQLGKINEALKWFDIEVDDIVSGEIYVTEEYAIAFDISIRLSFDISKSKSV